MGCILYKVKNNPSALKSHICKDDKTINIILLASITKSPGMLAETINGLNN